LDLLKSDGSERGVINQGQTVVNINGGHGLMGGTLWELSKLMIFKKILIRNLHLVNSCFLKFSMINLNLKYNNDDEKKKKNGNKRNWK